MPTLLMVIAAVLLFVNVTDFGALVWPIETFPQVSELGEALVFAVAATVPAELAETPHPVGMMRTPTANSPIRLLLGRRLNDKKCKEFRGMDCFTRDLNCTAHVLRCLVGTLRSGNTPIS